MGKKRNIDTGRKDKLQRPIKVSSSYGKPASTNKLIPSVTTSYDSNNLDNSILVPKKNIVLPSHYKSMMSTEEKISRALEAAEIVREKGFTPVSASVTGSRLRGVDGENSDTDYLVIVEEKLSKAKTYNLGEDDMQVQSLDMYLQKLDTSIPYLEFARSPFRISDNKYSPIIDNYRVNTYQWNKHAERFVDHLMHRNNINPQKRLRNSLCAWYMVKTGSPLCPREFVDATWETGPEEGIKWIKDIIDNDEFRK